MDSQEEIRSGYWRYDAETMRVVFEPFSEVHYNPEYTIELNRISTSGELLDWILQLQGKGRWEDNKWKPQCSDYQIFEFITVINLLCKKYLNTNVQAAFSPFGEHRKIDWDRLTSSKLIETTEN